MTNLEHNRLMEALKHWQVFLESYKSTGKAFINIQGFNDRFNTTGALTIENDSPELIELIINGVIADIEQKLTGSNNDTN